MGKCWIMSVTFVIILQYCLCEQTSSVVCSDRRRIDSSHASVLLDLVINLGWKQVNIIHENSTDAAVIDILVNELNTRGVLTVVLEFEVKVTTNSTLLVILQNGGGNVVLGFGDFARRVFGKVADYAEASNRHYTLFDTEWLTVVDEDDMKDLPNAITTFENVAVAVKRKVGSALFSISRGGQKLYQGFLVDLLDVLSQEANFSYVFVEAPPNDNSYGVKLDDGQWSGLIGMLIRKEADLAISVFRLTEERSKVVDPTSPFDYNDAWIVYRGSQQTTTDAMLFFTRPFQNMAYVAIGACFVAVSAFLLALQLARHYLTVQRESTKSGRSWVTWVSSLIQWICKDAELPVLALLGSLLNRSVAVRSESRAGRMLVCSWLLLGMLLTSLYSSKLTSSLTVIDQSPPFTSIADLVKQDTYIWGVRPGTAVDSLMEYSSSSVLQKYHKGTLQFAESDPDVRSRSLEVHKTKIFTENYAFLAGNIFPYETWSTEICDLRATGPVGLQASNVFYLQKGSPFTKILSEKIEKMVSTGLVWYWKRKWAPAKPTHCQQQDGGSQSPRTVSLVEVQTAFYMAAAGLVLAALALILEWTLKTGSRLTH